MCSQPANVKIVDVEGAVEKNWDEKSEFSYEELEHLKTKP